MTKLLFPLMGLRGLARREEGQSFVEMAMSLPLYGLLILGLALFAWWWWNNLVAASGLADGVRAAAVEEGNVQAGTREIREALQTSLGGYASEYGGSYRLQAIPELRSVRGTLHFEIGWPLLPLSLEVQGADFQRREAFYGGPPGIWE